MSLRVGGTGLLAAFALMLTGAAVAAGGFFAWLSPLVLAAGTFAAVRNWRLGVQVSRDGLVVANSFRTYSLSWGDVDRVVDNGGVRVRLRSGRELAVSAFMDVPGAFSLVRSRNARAAKELQTLVKRYRTT